MSPLPDTRYSLLVRLADPADAAAWTELTAIYQPAVLRYALSRGVQEADAWDVVQQVLLVLHQRAAQWRPSGRPGAFRRWMIEVARRHCLRVCRDAARRRRRHVDDGLNQAHLFAADVPVDADDAERRRWAFCWAAEFVEREVAPITWQAFQLTAVAGLSAEEAARRLGVRVGSVYTAKCRVLERLRRVVADLADDVAQEVGPQP